MFIEIIVTCPFMMISYVILNVCFKWTSLYNTSFIHLLPLFCQEKASPGANPSWLRWRSRVSCQLIARPTYRTNNDSHSHWHKNAYPQMHDCGRNVEGTQIILRRTCECSCCKITALTAAAPPCHPPCIKYCNWTELWYELLFNVLSFFLLLVLLE